MKACHWQYKSIHISEPYFSKIHFNIVLPVLESLPMRFFNQNFNSFVLTVSLPMGNRTNVVHKHIGSDTLEVEKYAIQDES
jgi:hypothetical protein